MNLKERARLGGLVGGRIQAEKRLQRELAWNLSPKLCFGCSKPLAYKDRRNKFCSHACATTLTNKNRYGNLPDKQCRECQSVLTDRNKSFCSDDCRFRLNQKEDSKLFNSGKMKDGKAKKYLISLYGNKCMECGWDKINQYSGKVPIDLEHVDGNYKNNLPSNLKLLCPCCHSLTPTYKGLNKGNGRPGRRKSLVMLS